MQVSKKCTETLQYIQKWLLSTYLHKLKNFSREKTASTRIFSMNNSTFLLFSCLLFLIDSDPCEAFFSFFSSKIVDEVDEAESSLYSCDATTQSSLCSSSCEQRVTPVLALCTGAAAFTRPFFLSLAHDSDSILTAFIAATLAALSPLCESDAPDPCVFCQEQPCLRGLFQKVENITDNWKNQLKMARFEFELNLNSSMNDLEEMLRETEMQLRLDAIYGEAWSAFATLDLLYTLIEDDVGLSVSESTLISLTSSPASSFFNLQTLSYSVASMIRDKDYSYLALALLDDCSSDEFRAVINQLWRTQLRVYEIRSFVLLRQGKSEQQVRMIVSRALAREMRRQAAYVERWCDNKDNNDDNDDYGSNVNNSAELDPLAFPNDFNASLASNII